MKRNQAATFGRNLLVAGGIALAAGTMTAGTADAAGLLVADGGFGGVLEIEQQDVDVVINNGIAVTNVTQVFRNTENRQVEALYTFPVPKDASVSNFSMWIGGKEVIGEVLKKERAREIYDSYKKVRRDPGLLEQTDYRTFEMRIFPIAAKAEQRVQITYYQELDFDNDWATYVYPLAKVTREDINSTTTGTFSFKMTAKSEVPIVSMESSSHGADVAIAKYSESLYEASLEQKQGDLARDVVVAYHTSRPLTGLDLLTSKHDDEDGHFCITLTAGEELAQKNDFGSDYVFVLDVSGSMADEGKLKTSTGTVGAFLDTLGDDDRFEVITFNVSPNPLFKQMTPANRDTRTQAQKFLQDQRAKGGTQLRPAIQTAYRYVDADRPLNVVVLSDGMTEQQERQELLAAIEQRPARSKVFCVGVGNEVNRPLLTQIAEDAGGLAAFISQGDDFNRQAEAFRRKLMHPVATNLQIEIDGVKTYDAEPATLPNLFHGSPVRLYGRYAKGGEANVTVRGEIGGQPFVKTSTLDFPKQDESNPEIDRMWAWHAMQSLQAKADRNGSRADVVHRIVELGEAYSIASEYTSFLVLENDAEYQRWKIERRNALRLGRDRKKQEALRKRLDGLRDQSLAEIGPIDSTKAVSQASAPKNPTTSALPAAQRPAPVSNDPPVRSSSRSMDFGGSGGGGGGAVDPLTALLASAIGVGFVLFPRKRKSEC